LEGVVIVGPLLVVGSLVFLWVYLDMSAPVLPGWLWVVALAFVAWLLSLKVLPKKSCYICKGKGNIGVWRFRRVCDRCRGDGVINRIGAGE
jgi:hypothetical protein